MTAVTVPRALLATGSINEYSAAAAARKKAMHTSGKTFFKRLVEYLGLSSSDFDIRSNLAGIAVSGEVTLHTDKIYLQISDSVMDAGNLRLLYRECAGRKDYCGGRNRYVALSDIGTCPEDMDRFLRELSTMQNR